MTFVRLLVAFVVCFSVGLLSSYTAATEIDGWYAQLAKPFGTPPNWLFPIVWNTLFVLMGISLWRLWERDSPGRRRALSYFVVQLLCNAAWAPTFFGAHQLFAALVIIVMLIISLAATIKAAWHIDKVAAGLLIPYFVWICYASWLNAGIWFLNSRAL